MLTKEQIRKLLQEDSYWEPDADASWEEWDLYEEVCAELDGEETTEVKGEASGEDLDELDGDEDWSDDDEDY